jgi:hypothetical protein
LMASPPQPSLPLPPLLYIDRTRVPASPFPHSIDLLHSITSCSCRRLELLPPGHCRPPEARRR